MLSSAAANLFPSVVSPALNAYAAFSPSLNACVISLITERNRRYMAMRLMLDHSLFVCFSAFFASSPIFLTPLDALVSLTDAPLTPCSALFNDLKAFAESPAFVFTLISRFSTVKVSHHLSFAHQNADYFLFAFLASERRLISFSFSRRFSTMRFDSSSFSTSVISVSRCGFSGYLH